MIYATFMEMVSQQLREKLGPEYRLELHQILKNNGVRLDGLSIRRTDAALAPTIYLNSYYEQYQGGLGIDEIIEDILRLFADYPAPGFLTDGLPEQFDQVRSRIMLRLIHAEMNRELLSDLPFIPYLDLAIVFYLFLESSDAGQMTTLIRNDNIRIWNIKKENLLRIALDNTPQRYPARIRSIEDVIRDMAKKHGFDNNQTGKETDTHFENDSPSESSANELPLYLLSNISGIYGAACILYPRILKDFVDELERDLFIIPSSIHEVLITPQTDEVSTEYLNQMVQNVNHTEVSLEDQLSDHIYLYTRADDRIHMIHN